MSMQSAYCTTMHLLSAAFDIAIEPMSPEDWPAVRAIFEEGIATGHATLETAAPDWERWDAAHMEHCRLVACHYREFKQHAKQDSPLERQVAGWAALGRVSTRRVYAGVAEVSVYVAAAARGQKVGSRLLRELVEASEREGIWTLQAGIFAENLPSQRLHAEQGFRVVGVRERLGCLHGKWRNIVLMERRSKVAGIE